MSGRAGARCESWAVKSGQYVGLYDVWMDGRDCCYGVLIDGGDVGGAECRLWWRRGGTGHGVSDFFSINNRSAIYIGVT